ncbi:MAG: hypothetical protein ACM3VZ_14545 [Acidobacteriota bacterium]
MPRRSIQISSLTFLLFCTVSACTAAPHQVILSVKDTAGQHTLTLTSTQQPIGDAVEFSYQLKGRKAECNLMLTGHAHKLTAKEIGPVDIDWNEYLPNGESVRYARFKSDGTVSAELDIDVQSKTPKFATFSTPLSAELKARHCVGASEAIEITFFR